ncbi:MAG: hypothetical protein Q8R33_00205 [Burkholderiales bacterium]|nr:hypothetical protein [Burkholderiales bacterium]
MESLLTQARPSLPARRKWLLGLASAAVLAPPLRLDAQASEVQPVMETLTLGASRLELQFAPGFDARLRAEAKAWVQRSADAVVAYFGRFPVPRVELLMVPADGAGVRGGVTYGEPSLLVRVRVGRETTKAQFQGDWIMVHEMVHLAVPRVPRSQNWLQEGLATYVESVARGRAGLVAPATVWREWAQAMPQGQPQLGDAGLDHTPTWGRTYWGGAVFCLLADVQMLTRSARRAGLQQALQGVLAAGGNYGVAWSVDRILATADAAVGQTTLTDLYRRMKDSPEPAALDALWRDLGVVGNTLDDNAPLAAVRRAILS